MRIPHSNRAPRGLVLGVLSITMVLLATGCTPLDAGEIETFTQDLFLGALAAFLL